MLRCLLTKEGKDLRGMTDSVSERQVALKINSDTNNVGFLSPPNAQRQAARAASDALFVCLCIFRGSYGKQRERYRPVCLVGVPQLFPDSNGVRVWGNGGEVFFQHRFSLTHVFLVVSRRPSSRLAHVTTIKQLVDPEFCFHYRSADLRSPILKGKPGFLALISKVRFAEG